jgi:hypothetical protein
VYDDQVDSGRATRLLIIAAALASAGCGAGDRDSAGGRASASAAPLVSARATELRTTIYFLIDGGRAPIGVRRTLVRTGDAPFAEQAVEALLAGPSAAEVRAGVTSAIPHGVQLRSFSTIGPGGTHAVVDLAGLPRNANAVERARVITQITRTVVGVSSITRVRLYDEGQPWGLANMQGVVPDRPHDYRELLGFYRICAAEPGTEAVEGDCFTALP